MANPGSPGKLSVKSKSRNEVDVYLGRLTGGTPAELCRVELDKGAESE